MANVRRYCIVPGCRNTTLTTPQKRFIYVPMNEQRRSSWLKAVRTQNQYSKKSTIFVCEDHFNVSRTKCFENSVKIFDEIYHCQGEVMVSLAYLLPLYSVMEDIVEFISQN